MKLITSNGISRYHREFFEKVIKFGLPAVFETLMTNIGGLLLSMIVGRNDINDSYAAFSLANNVFGAMSTMVVAVYVGITVVLIRHSIREGEDHGSVATTCILFSTACAAVISVLLYFFSSQVISLFYKNTEPHIFEATVKMFKMFTPALFFQLTTRAMTAAYRGLGNFRIPVSSMIFESVLTALFSLIFVQWMQLGMSGIVMTIVSSRIITFILLTVIWLSGKSVMKFRLPKKGSFRETIESVKIGLPTVLDSGGVQISYLILQTILVYVGTNALKGYQAANSVINFIYVFSSGMNVALVTVAGGYFSQMKLRKAKACAWYFTGITYLVAGSLAALCIIFSGPVISLFLKLPEAHDVGVKILIGLCLNVLLTQFIQVMPAFFKAIGDTTTVFVIGFTGSVVVRLPFAWLFIMKLHMGWLGIILALTIDFLYRFIFYLFKTYFAFRLHPVHAKHYAK